MPRTKSSGRALLVVVLIVIALAIAALIAYLLLAPQAPTAPERRPPPKPIEQAAEDGVTVKPATDEEQRHARHESPYPWVEMIPEITALKQPPELEPMDSLLSHQGHITTKLLDHNITVRIEGNLETCVNELNALIADTGHTVRTGKPAYNPAIKFKLFFSDMPVQTILGHLREQSPGGDLDIDIDPRPPGGFLVGSSAFTTLEREKMHTWDLNRRLKEEHADPILATKYRPDYSDATIEAVVAHIQAQTGVPTVADQLTWERQDRITWRGQPMTLKKALEGLAEKLECTYRVQNGRVYLMVIRTSLH